MATDADTDPGHDVPPRIVRCPGCGGESVYALTNPWRPFCSQRCRSGDLGAWSSEGYRVAARPEVDDDLGEGAPGD